MAFDPENPWTDAERKAWAWPRYSSVREWAEATLVLPARDPEPGPYRASRTPYIIPILEAVGSPWVEQVALKSARQVCKTMLELVVGCYAIDQYPTRLLYLMGRDEDAETIAGERFRPLIEASPKLAKHITGPRCIQKDKIRLNGSLLQFATANSAGAIASTPWEKVLFDETHLYKASVGSEGSPITIARKSMENYSMKQAILVSSCTNSQSDIHHEYMAGNQGRWHVVCPHCNRPFFYKFSQIKIPENERNPERIRSMQMAWYECEYCKGVIGERDKERVLQSGFYVYANQTVERPSKVSFWVDGISSPWRTYSGIMAEFLECKDDRSKLLAFKNTTLGEEVDERVETISVAEPDKWILENALERGVLPKETQLLTSQVDWHGDKKGYYYNVWAWAKVDTGMEEGIPFTAWLVDAGQVFSTREIEERLYDREWRVGNASLRLFGGVDSGWETEEVYQFTRMRYPFVKPTRGENVHDVTAAVRETPIDYQSSRTGKKYSGFSLLRIQTLYYKDALSRYLQLGPERCPFRFFKDTPPVLFDHLQAEHKVTVKGKKIWVPIFEGKDNHYLDCLIGAWAIAEHWRLKELKPQKESIAEATVAPPERSFAESGQGEQRQGWLRRNSRGSWIRR